MRIEAAVADYDRLRRDVFQLRESMAGGRRLALALLFAFSTGVMAQLRFQVPWTPVPVTGQVLAVLMAGAIKGGRWGALSQSIYLFLGVAGVPWFNGFSSGLSVLAGPTGGYLLGFVPAALAVGHIVDRCGELRTLPRLLAVLSSVTLFCIYLPGIVQLAFWYRAAAGSFPSVGPVLMAGVIPFLPGEAVKILYAGLFIRIAGPPAVKPFSEDDGFGIDRN